MLMSYVLITSQERRLFKSRYWPQCYVTRPLRGVKGNETLLLPSFFFICDSDCESGKNMTLTATRLISIALPKDLLHGGRCWVGEDVSDNSTLWRTSSIPSAWNPIFLAHFYYSIGLVGPQLFLAAKSIITHISAFQIFKLLLHGLFLLLLFSILRRWWCPFFKSFAIIFVRFLEARVPPCNLSLWNRYPGECFEIEGNNLWSLQLFPQTSFSRFETT